MASKSASILIPGVMCMIIGFFVLNVVGAGLGLILGFAMGECYYQRHELEKQIDELKGSEQD
ncbi:hypothetical protein [Natrinema limicola]|uniref:Uncharacterized protein n=1 Tax=Natrinema limicola JCM 13563 TaxID=1230457 RepID=M0BY65_9EURY|nr:hypothetical protein [Natrinema limicola]ELZ15976.1 hypothetical protein C476_17202 [Natrinema limicola JCM 13563]